MSNEGMKKENAEVLDNMGEKIREGAHGGLEGIEKGLEGIEKGVVSGYQKIEDAVVGGYKKIEEGVVEGFNRVSDKFIEKLFTKEGESVEEAKARLRGEDSED